MSASPPERLNRFLARRGVASRRGADALIADGRVTINGKPSRLGAVVDPSVDRVSVDGHRIPARAVSVTVVLNKPVGVVTTRSDPYQRRTVMDLIEPVPGLVPVGRLDAEELERLPAVEGRRDLMPGGFQHGLSELHDFRTVVDDQNMGHGRAPQ